MVCYWIINGTNNQNDLLINNVKDFLNTEQGKSTVASYRLAMDIILNLRHYGLALFLENFEMRKQPKYYSFYELA